MAEFRLIETVDNVRAALNSAWDEIRNEDGYYRPARLGFPGGGAFDDDIYVLPTLNCAFYRWKGTGSRSGIWSFANHHSRKVLTPDFEFNLPNSTSAYAGRIFGRVISDRKRLKLAHVGRLGGGRNSVSGAEFRQRASRFGVRPVKVADQNFFVISDLEEGRVASDFLNFAALCRAIRDNQQTPPRTVDLDKAQTKAVSTGPFKGGMRAEVIFEARHAPIVKNLFTMVKKFGWRAEDSAKHCKPDLVCGRGKRKILFEVKPNASVHSLICAVGQCKVCGFEHKVDRSIIIALGSQAKVKGWVIQAIKTLGVKIVFAEREATQGYHFRFDANDELITPQ